VKGSQSQPDFEQSREGRRDFLLEIGTEEIPARFLGPALAELKEMAGNALCEQRLGYENVATFGTPRRLVLYVGGMAAVQDSFIQEVKGPAARVAFKPDGSPTRAASGFAAGQGVAVADLVRRPVGHVDYVFAVKREAGRPAREVLAELAPALIGSLHFPRPMRWGCQEVRFARPVRWLLALLGEEVVDFTFAGLEAGRVTFGHRFLCREPLVIVDPRDYFDKMRAGYVIVDGRERQQTIWCQVQELAGEAGGRVEPDEELLEEISNLVEYPTAFTGNFDSRYLELPPAVLVTPMRGHQRYFPVYGPDGRLLPRFIGVANSAPGSLAAVRTGNERVLRARLADADFFYREDLKTPLAGKVPGLKKVVFQETLGTVFDKMTRVSALSGYLAVLTGVNEQDRQKILRAAYLAKADLVTAMVYEFPELQGVMGREYALCSGEDRLVAEAIFEHYLPRFAGDKLPATFPGRILGIADKMDSIAGCFALGIQPTGSQDPYALRRQAAGVSQIILDGSISLSLTALVERAYNEYESQVKLKLGLAQVKTNLSEFFQQRLKNIFIDQGFSYDTVDAVLSAGYDDFYDAYLRVQSLHDIRPEPDFADLLTAFTRAHNLSRNADSLEVTPGLFADPAENTLFECLSALEEEARIYLTGRDYRAFFAAVAVLKEPLERFFNSVMVMVEDERLRKNRLAILKRLAVLVKRVADLSKIVVLS
jgi:glycyl-tRNA synthetase beta chain